MTVREKHELIRLVCDRLLDDPMYHPNILIYGGKYVN
jgi:hypothetical protein